MELHYHRIIVVLLYDEIVIVYFGKCFDLNQCLNVSLDQIKMLINSCNFHTALSGRSRAGEGEVHERP